MEKTPNLSTLVLLSNLQYSATEAKLYNGSVEI